MASNTSMSAALIASANCRILSRLASSSISVPPLEWFWHREGSMRQAGLPAHRGDYSERYSVLRGGRQALGDGPRGDLRASAEPELGQDVLDVVLGGPLGQEQDPGDLPVGQAPGDQHRHLPLPPRQQDRPLRGREVVDDGFGAGPEHPHPEGRCGAGGPFSQVEGLAAGTSLAAEQLCQHELGSGGPGPGPGPPEPSSCWQSCSAARDVPAARPSTWLNGPPAPQRPSG